MGSGTEPPNTEACLYNVCMENVKGSNSLLIADNRHVILLLQIVEYHVVSSPGPLSGQHALHKISKLTYNLDFSAEQFFDTTSSHCTK